MGRRKNVIKLWDHTKVCLLFCRKLLVNNISLLLLFPYEDEAFVNNAVVSHENRDTLSIYTARLCQ